MEKTRPVIGIVAALAADERVYEQRVTYMQAVWATGGDVVLLPCNPDKTNCRNIAGLLDGLLTPGGGDIDPVFYGEEEIEECGAYRRFEDEYEMELIREVVNQGKPVLGICRGIQIVNTLYGGTLYQDIPVQYGDKIIHTRINQTEENYHTVTIEENSYLAKILGETKNVKVNTSHHQAVKDVADGFRVTAKAPDGIIEAIENDDASILCVQWHPERMQDEEMWRRFIKDFVDRCR